MNEEGPAATLEVIAPSVEEAIEKGLAELGLPEDAVEVEILDRGTRGLFGLGNRQARIRLIVKKNGESSSSSAQSITQVRQELLASAQVKPQFDSEEDEELVEGDGEEEIDPVLQVAEDTVTDLLDKMNVDAQIRAHFEDGGDDDQKRLIWIDITGKDLSILIGRKNQTLYALQYITTLIVSKELGEPATVVIDVEGYRVRRQKQLRRIAKQMAEQAIRTGRRQTLEPMPANERRIIHMELREFDGVSTESVGEEPFRKVTIIPLARE